MNELNKVMEYTAASKRLIEEALGSGNAQMLSDIKLLMDTVSALQTQNEMLIKAVAECQELLVEMVNQYCRNHSDEPTTYSHDFMSTGEAVFDYLVNHGLADWALNGIDIRLRKGTL